MKSSCESRREAGLRTSSGGSWPWALKRSTGADPEKASISSHSQRPCQSPEGTDSTAAASWANKSRGQFSSKSAPPMGVSTAAPSGSEGDGDSRRSLSGAIWVAPTQLAAHLVGGVAVEVVTGSVERHPTYKTVSYKNLTLPTNREV